LYLVRHGITAANKEDRFAGRTDEPLHPEGEAQASAVADRLRGAGISAVVAGPLRRTRETAGIIAEKLGVAVMTLPALDEIAIPHWDGLTKAEIRQRFGPEYPTWLDTPERFQVAGCESIGDVQQRVVAAVAAMAQEYAGRSVLVVSHLIPLRALLLHHLGQPISAFRSIKIANAQLVRLTMEPGNGQGRVEFLA
ncbi:MAG: histidine phosphatase family protein, partial [Thermodesulfobacteriota bacterium]